MSARKEYVSNVNLIKDLSPCHRDQICYAKRVPFLSTVIVYMIGKSVIAMTLPKNTALDIYYHYLNHSKFQGRSTSLTGLQNQYTGYNYNLADVVSPY